MSLWLWHVLRLDNLSFLQVFFKCILHELLKKFRVNSFKIGGRFKKQPVKKCP